MQYILYKQPIQLETLNIVQYLHNQLMNLLPSVIFERNYPPHITDLPAIQTPKELYLGIDRVVYFYGKQSGITNLLQKATYWKTQNPKYTIKK